MQPGFPLVTRPARASWVRSLRPRLAIVALLLAPLACGGEKDSPTGPPETVTLVSGTPVDVAGAEGSQTLYRITVPSGATQIVAQTRGGTGDVDMYMRAGEPPTPAALNCASERLTNEEDCELFNPQAGAWYVLLVGYEAYAGVTLTVTVTSGTVGTAP